MSPLPILTYLLLILGSCLALHPDTGLTTIEIIQRYGYPAESHEVQTSDGYLLTMHRIPHGLTNTTGPRPAVFLMHGTLSCSLDWVNNGPLQSLGFLLANAGYDVWIGNQRGNTYSRKHISLDPDLDDKQFFYFSFHEIGAYDLPAMIDYILATTGETQIFYVGHSQGTTAFFVMAAFVPAYNAKIKHMTALGPGVFMSNAYSPSMQYWAANLDLFEATINLYGLTEMSPHTAASDLYAVTTCANIFTREICADSLFNVGGWDSPQLDRDLLPVIYSSSPAGGSIRQSLHFLQEVHSGRFCQIDDGPDYDISQITAPVSIWYGENDWIVDPTDVAKLSSVLPNLVSLHPVAWPDWAHLDFLWGTDLARYVSNDVVAEIVSLT